MTAFWSESVSHKSYRWCWFLYCESRWWSVGFPVEQKINSIPMTTQLVTCFGVENVWNQHGSCTTTARARATPKVLSRGATGFQGAAHRSLKLRREKHNEGNEKNEGRAKRERREGKGAVCSTTSPSSIPCMGRGSLKNTGRCSLSRFQVASFFKSVYTLECLAWVSPTPLL